MRRITTAPFLFVALLALSAAPASAAPFVGGTWWAALDGWFAQPANLNLDAAVADRGRFARGGEVLGPSFGHEFSGRIRFGWRGEPDQNAYAASFWWWDSDASMEAAGGLIPALSDPLITSNDFANSMKSAADVEAQVFDLMLIRRLTGKKKATWYWSAGARYAKYDQDWHTDYFEPDPNIPINKEEDVDVAVESTGTGISLGLAGTYQWHPKWRTFARAQTALLKGSTDSSILDKDLRFSLPPFAVSAITRDGHDRVYQQWEIEARVAFNAWQGLDVSFGYAFLNWSDVAQVDRYLDDVQAGLSFTRQSVSFDGFVLGVSYAFP